MAEQEQTKKRKIRQADWDKVEQFVNDEYSSRQKSQFRKDAENIWKEVDRQVAMKPMTRAKVDGKPVGNDWRAAIELGELAKASEIIASDVMRIMFPQDRHSFRPHVELDWPLGQNGKPVIDSDKQDIADGLLRNLMAQQHKDFGFKARFRLSVKESLHHGSFVAEVRQEEQLMVRDGDKVRKVAAPVWVPYSMWNAYPDPSPSVIGTNLFYTGSMILKEYCPLSKLKRMAEGDGWIKERLSKVEEKRHKNKDSDTKDVELVKYKGDITITRGDGDIYLPNSEVILANGVLVFYAPAQLDYPNVIFGGYERQDVRDPYYTSPIIKLSPMHKAMTVSMNKFLDWAALTIEPPIEYDANDPDYVANDGPLIAPGAKTGTKAMGAGFKQLQIGEGTPLLKGVEFMYRQHQEGLGVSSMRAGVESADRQTATEASLLSQGAEVRTMEFVSQLEPQALLPFLYMQHELNRKKMDEYTFYSDEMHTPDFVRAKKKDIQANAHFEVVGSRGVLGEMRRKQELAQTVAFLSANPLFAPVLKTTKIAEDMVRDAGKKDAEEWVTTGQPEIPAEVKQKLQQQEQMIQELSQRLQKAESGTQKAAIQAQAHVQGKQIDAQTEIQTTVIHEQAESQRKAQEQASSKQEQGMKNATTLAATMMKAKEQGVRGAGEQRPS
jgi:hypothetical protein